jgi:formylglycine-generating enzyme required for sulfatase activity
VIGNVEEWVADPWHKDYQGAPKEGQVWAGNRCLGVISRGGAWPSQPKNLRLAYRKFMGSSDFSSTSRGFRIVRSEESLTQAQDETELQCQSSIVLKEGKKIFRHVLKDGGKGPEMVILPAGTFKMGDIQGGGSDREKPVHEVSVARFAIGRYEVTFAEYDQFAKATGRIKPDDEGWGRGKHPVINVTWYDAKAYTEWLTEQTGKQYSLPSEAQWEYAARAGTETKYWWGNEIGENRANCRNCGSQWDGSSTAPVGSFGPNPFGLYDTAGNVWEWISDSWHKDYFFWFPRAGAYRYT